MRQDNPSIESERRPATPEEDEKARIDEKWTTFRRFLRKEKKGRVTRERETVFRNVMARDDHFRADQLAAELAQGKERVSRGTVYRTLALMVEAGFARAIRDEDSHYHYERAGEADAHEHMICGGCGAFIEFEAPDVAEAIQRHCRRMGFEEEFHRVAVFGRCAPCARRAREGGNGEGDGGEGLDDRRRETPEQGGAGTDDPGDAREGSDIRLESAG